MGTHPIFESDFDCLTERVETMSWDGIAVTASRILRYSTPFGHAWNFGTFMCRLLPATTIGEAVYGDEMSDFECVTTQPGCRQVCYNQFSPMTHTRFWSMHILILSFPPILYSFIAANFNAKYTILQKRLTEEIDSNDNRSLKGSVRGSVTSNTYTQKTYYGSDKYYKDKRWLDKVQNKTRKNINPDEDDNVAQVLWAPTMRRWYVIQLILKLLIELFGVYCLHRIQLFQNPGAGFFDVWTIPIQYLCKDLGIYEQFACSQEFQVPCWVPRPWEKRIFLLYMLMAQTLAIILILLDLIYVVTKVSVKKMNRRKQRKTLLAPDTVSLFSEKNKIDE